MLLSGNERRKVWLILKNDHKSIGFLFFSKYFAQCLDNWKGNTVNCEKKLHSCRANKTVFFRWKIYFLRISIVSLQYYCILWVVSYEYMLVLYICTYDYYSPAAQHMLNTRDTAPPPLQTPPDPPHQHQLTVSSEVLLHTDNSANIKHMMIQRHDSWEKSDSKRNICWTLLWRLKLMSRVGDIWILLCCYQLWSNNICWWQLPGLSSATVVTVLGAVVIRERSGWRCSRHRVTVPSVPQSSEHSAHDNTTSQLQHQL